jgi:glycine/D-amino acid oxidase-like deaminating enzyme
VNPLRLLRALHAAIVAEGGVCRSCARVESIEASPAGGYALATQTGRIAAERVVLAAGLGNATLAAAAGLAAPVRPQRGEILVLERQPQFLAHPTTSLRQTDEGTVLIGDSQEDVGFDDSVDVSVLSSMATRAVRTFPRLADARIARAWGALRVTSPDGYPIYDQSQTMPGVFLAACPSGVTLAPAHALMLAPWIDEGALPADLAPFGTQRFDVRAAA